MTRRIDRKWVSPTSGCSSLTTRSSAAGSTRSCRRCSRREGGWPPCPSRAATCAICPRCYGLAGATRSRSLGQALCVFEKILTGIADGVPIRSGGAEYPADQGGHRCAAQTVQFLEHASRIPVVAGLLGGARTRTDVDRISKAQADHRDRIDLPATWLEAGLHAYLDIYVQTPARPRIAIDDGSASVVRKNRGPPARLRCPRSHSARSYPLRRRARAPGRPEPCSSGRPRSRWTARIITSWSIRASKKTTAATKRCAFPRYGASQVPVRSLTHRPLPCRSPDPGDEALLYRTATAAVVDNFDRCSVVSVGDPTSIKLGAFSLGSPGTAQL